MAFETTQLLNDRYLEGIVRCGRVTKVSTNNCIAATVTYPDRGFQTGYLTVMQRNTIGYKDYYVPIEGEPVWVIMQGRNQNRGLILGSAYTADNPPPYNSQTIRGVVYGDGSYVIYDTAGGGNYQISTVGKITIASVGDTTITTKGKVNANGVLIDTNGNMTIPGTLTVAKNVIFQAGGTIKTNLQNLDGSGGGS